MEWVKIIAPLIGVILGWGLSEKAKLWADNRQDNRKLKRLLFYILELRFHFTRELNVHNFIDFATARFKSEFGEKVELDVETYKPLVFEILKNNFKEDNKLDYLEENIDSVIVDLSEVFPIFAYELSGQHRIKEKLKKSDNYLNELEGLAQDMPFDLKDWIQPKITKNLLLYLDNNLTRIALKINKKTAKEVKEKIYTMDNRDNSDVEAILEDYIQTKKKRD